MTLRRKIYHFEKLFAVMILISQTLIFALFFYLRSEHLAVFGVLGDIFITHRLLIYLGGLKFMIGRLQLHDFMAAQSRLEPARFCLGGRDDYPG